jgi:hypothetical protein
MGDEAPGAASDEGFTSGSKDAAERPGLEHSFCEWLGKGYNSDTLTLCMYFITYTHWGYKVK